MGLQPYFSAVSTRKSAIQGAGIDEAIARVVCGH